MLPPQGFQSPGQYYQQQQVQQQQQQQNHQMAAMYAAQVQAQAQAQAAQAQAQAQAQAAAAAGHPYGGQQITQQQLMVMQMQAQQQALAKQQQQQQAAAVAQQQAAAQAQAQAVAQQQAAAQAAAAQQAAHAQAQAQAQVMGSHPHMHAGASRPSLASHGSASHHAAPYRPQVPPPQPPPQVAYHPETYPAGPLGFFLPPPGQRSLDPTLSTPPVTQAFYTTYPSRLRTGVTALVQPENVTGGPKEREAFMAEMEREIAGARSSGANTPRFESPAPSRPSRTTTTTLSGRRAGRINYAEAEESEEEEESSEEEVEEAGSDPEDLTFGERRRKRDPLLEREVQNRIVRIKRKHTEMERGWTWLGDRVPAERVRSAVAAVTKHQQYTQQMLHAVDTPEMLVPITIDIDIPSPTGDSNGIKIKDRFLWNAADVTLRPREFAVILCDDLGVKGDLVDTIASLIQSQLDEAQPASFIDLQTDDATANDVVWSEDEDDEPKDEGKFVEPDCRIIINLDVQIFTHVLRDRIEWDLSSPLPPSEFSRHYCAELGLTGEAIPLVAHAIHEELLKHKRDALELDLFQQTHPGEQAKWERTTNAPKVTNRYGARKLVGVWRDWFERDEFSPLLVELSMEEMEKREAERSRESRRMMRTLGSKRRR